MEYPRIYNAASDMVDRHIAAGRDGKPAFIDAEGMLTYGALAARCNQMANILGAFGIARETRVAVLMLDTNDYPPVFWGAIKAGIVPVPVNLTFRAST